MLQFKLNWRYCVLFGIISCPWHFFFCPIASSWDLSSNRNVIYIVQNISQEILDRFWKFKVILIHNLNLYFELLIWYVLVINKLHVALLIKYYPCHCGDLIMVVLVVVTWCFTPSQPVQLYLGDRIMEYLVFVSDDLQYDAIKTNLHPPMAAQKNWSSCQSWRHSTHCLGL